MAGIFTCPLPMAEGKGPRPHPFVGSLSVMDASIHVGSAPAVRLLLPSCASALADVYKDTAWLQEAKDKKIVRYSAVILPFFARYRKNNVYRHPILQKPCVLGSKSCSIESRKRTNNLSIRIMLNRCYPKQRGHILFSNLLC